MDQNPTTPPCLPIQGTIEYATFTDRLQPGEVPTKSSAPSSTPSFHGANGLNYRAPAEAAGRKLGRGVEFDPVAVPAGGCVVHAQDCWHGSAPNVSTHRHRRALVVHFLRGDVNFIGGHSLEVRACCPSSVRRHRKCRVCVIRRRCRVGLLADSLWFMFL